MDSQQKRHITHVIFDVDGLILDTEILYTEASSEILARYGKEFTWEIKSKQMGQKEHVGGQILIDMTGIPLTVDQYLPELHNILAQKFPTCTLLPGAERLIRHLSKHGVPICVATGSDQPNYSKKMEGHKELFSLFHHHVTASDDPEVSEGKPAPDCFLVAAKRFSDQPKPQQTLVFEDSPNGVEAGLRAGMCVVWVPDARADTTIYAGRVEAILDSLERFQPQDYGLPPFDE